MNNLRESIRWRSYAQKDPLIEYKSEGYKLFSDLIKNIRRSVIYDILRAHIA
jgi:preprotein translocase subunit SecA